MIQKKQKQRRKIHRSSSEFSFFTHDKENSPLLSFHVAQDYSWLSEIWDNLGPIQRIEAMLPYSDDKGRNLLTRAVRSGDHPLMHTLLLNPSLNVNQQDIYGNTALHHAVLAKDGGALRILLDSPRVIANIPNRDLHTVCDLIKGYSDSDVFKDILEEYCLARLILERTICDYCLTHADKIIETSYDDKILTLMQGSIQRLCRDYWTVSAYKDRPFPVDLVPVATQNQIINLRFETCIGLRLDGEKFTLLNLQ